MGIFQRPDKRTNDARLDDVEKELEKFEGRIESEYSWLRANVIHKLHVMGEDIRRWEMVSQEIQDDVQQMLADIADIRTEVDNALAKLQAEGNSSPEVVAAFQPVVDALAAFKQAEEPAPAPEVEQPT